MSPKQERLLIAAFLAACLAMVALVVWDEWGPGSYGREPVSELLRRRGGGLRDLPVFELPFDFEADWHTTGFLSRYWIVASGTVDPDEFREWAMSVSRQYSEFDATSTETTHRGDVLWHEGGLVMTSRGDNGRYHFQFEVAAETGACRLTFGPVW